MGLLTSLVTVRSCKLNNMKIYIASRFADRVRLRKVADKIWTLGHEVTSTWLNEVTKMPSMTRAEFWQRLARKDLQEIAASDLFIRDVHRVSHTGGADTEFGFALARHQHCLIWTVGYERNIFHTLADKHFANWDEAIKELKKYD
jgi:hypothetical protein